MKSVLVKNITNKDQTVILIPENKAVTLNPKSSVVIDTYDEAHSYLYKSYQRKGLKVTFVDDSITESKPILPKTPKVEEVPKTLESTIEETVSNTTFEPLPEITEENINEVKESIPVEDKPKKRSRKSKSSDNSEETSATTESGE